MVRGDIVVLIKVYIVYLKYLSVSFIISFPSHIERLNACTVFVVL